MPKVYTWRKAGVDHKLEIVLNESSTLQSWRLWATLEPR